MELLVHHLAEVIRSDMDGPFASSVTSARRAAKDLGMNNVAEVTVA
ncbi:MAG: hypothetical protein ACRDRP_20750 [Pseudonocardiaceae bacterium]